jgi:pimeloyl-ACP methyl ester carboxylesterase
MLYLNYNTGRRISANGRSLANTLEDLIQRNPRITSIDIIGHSMGGYIVLAYFKKYQKDLSGLGLFHSHAFADSEIKITIRKKAISFINTNGGSAFLKLSTPELFHNLPTCNHAMALLLQNGKSFNKKTLIQYYDAMAMRTSTILELSEAQIPVLLIVGQYDKTMPFNELISQSYLPKQTHLYILRNTGHMGMIEEAKKSTTILTNFLNHINII